MKGSDPVDIKAEMLIAPNRYQIVDNFVFNRDSKKVEVRRITKDMGGQYVITATNAFGFANDYFTLLVLDGNLAHSCQYVFKRAFLFHL